MTNRRQAINEAQRDLFDELVELTNLLGPGRAAKTAAIVRRALIAEHIKGEQVANGEHEANRLAYDSEELELKYEGGDEHGSDRQIH